VVGRWFCVLCLVNKERAMSTTAAPDSDKRTADDHRDAIMTIVEELVRSLVPDELRSEDTRSRLKSLFVEVSEALETAAERSPIGAPPYALREWFMMSAEELALSLVPEDQDVPQDMIHRLGDLQDEVSNALGIASDDEGPLL